MLPLSIYHGILVFTIPKAVFFTLFFLKKMPVCYCGTMNDMIPFRQRASNERDDNGKNTNIR